LLGFESPFFAETLLVYAVVEILHEFFCVFTVSAVSIYFANLLNLLFFTESTEHSSIKAYFLALAGLSP